MKLKAIWYKKKQQRYEKWWKGYEDDEVGQVQVIQATLRAQEAQQAYDRAMEGKSRVGFATGATLAANQKQIAEQLADAPFAQDLEHDEGTMQVLAKAKAIATKARAKARAKGKANSQ